MNRLELNQVVIGDGEPSFRQFIFLSTTASASTAFDIRADRYFTPSVTASATGVLDINLRGALGASALAFVSSVISTTTATAKYIFGAVFARASAAFERLLIKAVLAANVTPAATITGDVLRGYGRYVLLTCRAGVRSNVTLSGKWSVHATGAPTASGVAVLNYGHPLASSETAQASSVLELLTGTALYPAPKTARAITSMAMQTGGVRATADRTAYVKAETRRAEVKR